MSEYTNPNIPNAEPLSFEKVWLMFQDTDKKFQESRVEMQEWIAESRRREKRVDREMKALQTLFTGHWGALIESLVEGKLVELLKSKNIDIETTYTRVVNESKDMEIDIIAANGNDVVVVEVKTTLKNDDLEYFIEKLGRFKECFKHFQNNRILGAVAFLRADAGIIRKSEKLGLYIIKATGDSAKIINKEKFEPKAW